MNKKMIPAMVERARRKLGLSTREFAKHLGVEHSTVWRWSTGRSVPSDDKFQVLLATAGTGLEPDRFEEPRVTTSTSVIVPATPQIEERFVRHEHAEAGLVMAAGQITAAWITALRSIPSEAKIMAFIQKTTRALRAE